MTELEVHIHELTGHECVYPRPDGWTLPKTFTVTVYPSDQEGEDDIWYASIKGECPDGKPFDQLTYGETPAHATLMAADVVRMLFDACDASGHGDVTGQRSPIRGKHCYCRDVTATGAFPQPFVDATMPRAAKQCCRCTQVTVLCEFGPEPKFTWPCPGKPEDLKGQPIGMYHCEYCGEMQIAGVPHCPPQFPEQWTGEFPKVEELEEPQLEWRPIEPYNHEDGGDYIMTIQAFIDAVSMGAFNDDDGHGECATETQVSNVRIYPSALDRPSWTTHVCWYNK